VRRLPTGAIPRGNHLWCRAPGTVWKGGDLDADESYERRDIEVGDVIAEGVEGQPGYGGSPVERAHFITGVIRDHLGRQQCGFHTSPLREMVGKLGVPVRWCPSCGERV